MENDRAERTLRSVAMPAFVATVNRLAPYVAGWLVLLLVVALTPLNAAWHAADFWFLQDGLHLGRGLAPDRELSFVDLGVSDAVDVGSLRSREIGLLDALTRTAGFAPIRPNGDSGCERAAVHLGPRRADANLADLPSTIVFDIAFSNAASRLEPRCVDPLVRELSALRRIGVKLYAAQDLESSNGGGSITGRFEIDPNFEANHDARVYAEIARSGHTLFTSDPSLPGGPLFYYPKIVRIPAAANSAPGAAGSCALAIVAVGRADDLCLPLMAQDESSDASDEVVAVGSTTTFAARLVAYGAALAHPEALAGKIVLVGDEALDTAAGDPRSKFEVVGWALSQSLADARGRPQARVLIDTGVMLGLALLCGALALGAFVLASYVFRSRRYRLIGATLGGLAFPVALLAAIVAALQAHGELYSQITLPLFTIFATVGIALWAAINAVRGDLFVTRLQSHETSVPERYDVFISYARTAENSKWVTENVLAPLTAARTANGKPLRIFFDKQNIKVGYSWYTTIVEAVYGSRFFIPVYSEGYFERPFCRDELDIAMLRQVGADAFILPVARVTNDIPTRYARVQFVDASETGFIESILSTIELASSRA